MNILNAITYEEMCDYVIMPEHNKFFNKEILEKSCVVFCKTEYINSLFDLIRNLEFKYVILTHHCDYSIDYFLFKNKPNNVIKWYCINKNYINNDLISIPLGTFWENDLIWFDKEKDLLKENIKEDIFYCNWNNNTNKYRYLVLNKLKDLNLNLKIESGVPFKEYITNMSKCKYVISPPGNGIDCYRTWESLYLGCIPIVIKHDMYDQFSDLPIIQVDDYSLITKEYLEKYINKEFNYEKLSPSFWKKEINNFI